MFSHRLTIGLLTAVAGLLFLPFLGGVHLFDWDEINFAECAREMLARGEYLTVTIDFQPFWEKPPFFIWLQAVSMSLFGVNEFSARLPNALCGMLTLPLLYLLGVRIRNRTFGLWWAVVYMGTLLPHLYFRSGIIDPCFNLLIFTSLYCFFASRKLAILLLSAVLMGLALLTKGPVALLIALLTIVCYAVFYRKKTTFSPLELVAWMTVSGLIFLIWFGIDFFQNGACRHHDFSGVPIKGLIPVLQALPCTMAEFIAYHLRLASTEDAGHGGFIGYHVVVLAVGCFPAFIFAVSGLLRFRAKDSEGDQVTDWLRILFWVVLIVFSLVKTKIVHYSSLAYFPLTYFTARWVEDFVSAKINWKKYHSLYIGIVGGLFGMVLTALPFVMLNKDKIIPLIKDSFARANFSADVFWSPLHGILGIFWLGIVVMTLIYVYRKQALKAMICLWGGMTIAIASVLYVIVPKVEPITQGAAIAFFASLKGKNAYVYTLHYKSYAHYFYAEVPNFNHPEYRSPNRETWLKEGNVDRPVYFSMKINRASEYRTEKYRTLGWREVGEKNGFVFFCRTPQR
jgi:4-amino-4-deoxy-L-arabinose transferase-like glycosyltransferase